jgi:acylpyruvate hydrolase
MKVDGEDRAGMVIGDEVLDLTRYLESFPLPGDDSVSYRLKDALDAYSRGMEKLQKVKGLVEEESEAQLCRQTGALIPLTDVKLNPPVVGPSKILAVGLNYAAHAAEQAAKLPESPLIFSKCTTALIGPNDSIRLPRISDMIDYEAELAIVIGKEARSVSRDRAMEYIAGFTIMNDVTARDLQKRERQWARAKGLDTFAPCGPWLVTPDETGDPGALDIELRVNGEIRQRSNTSDLIYDIPTLIEFISQDLTLRPGDIISTGTPSGVGVFLDPPVFLKAGDQIEIKIERIGTLSNTVAARAS